MTDYKQFLDALATLETRRDGSGIIPGTNNPYNIKDFSGGGIVAHDKAEGSRDSIEFLLIVMKRTNICLVFFLESILTH